ncbi:MAG TPA: phenylacetate--CoA ligase family protein [Proteobacteria bacterium]|nr:phenylacetate-coenzyme A ligase [bacterium BMS3Abin14]HDL54066.1 phenylacetate--CoA ligase family protein [Pseudomonadota bacterium]
MFQPDRETLSREELAREQLKKLHSTVGRIREKNPDYHARIGSPDPGEIRSLEDIGEIPFMSKDDLRDGYPFRFACAPRESFVRMHMSSGTTGTPIITPYTTADVDQWGEIMARCFAAARVGSEDVVQITPSFGLFNGGFGFHYGAARLGSFIVPIGAGRSSLQLQFMKDLGTTALTAIASYPLRLMDIARQEGFDWGSTRLKVGIFGAEVWSDEMRARIEEEMGIEAYDIIGMTETGGVGLGIDCPARAGIHIWEDHYLVEIVDPESGDMLPDGQTGEMVVTTLTREALPLIRFRTRDITSVVSREKCGCGRTHMRIARITGRTDDMIKVKGVNFFPRQIESLLLKEEGMGNDYLIEVERIHGADRLQVTVEVENPSDMRLAGRLGEILRDFLGFGAKISLLPLGGIEKPPGKAVRIVDRRQKA